MIGYGTFRDPQDPGGRPITVAEYVARNRRESVARETVAEMETSNLDFLRECTDYPIDYDRHRYDDEIAAQIAGAR